MIGNINHIAIAVPDLETAAARWRDTLGADVSAPQSLPEHGVRIVFVTQLCHKHNPDAMFGK